MVTASAATPTLNGHLPVPVLMMIVPCCLTYLDKDTSLFHNKRVRYGVVMAMDLILLEVQVMLH